ncbi:MAG: rRNA biogenesis protein rrp5 [Piccolia ochrophora]|nr:MAG: rRNA biogenesis protein rrp5 [Piccolia ochrophora]
MAPIKSKRAAVLPEQKRRSIKGGAEAPPSKRVRALSDASAKTETPSKKDRVQKTTKSSPSVHQPAKPSLLREEEPAFPRGGASVLTPLEHKQINIDADRDVLFEQASRKHGAGASSADDEDAAVVSSDRPKKKRRISSSRGEVDHTAKGAQVYPKPEGLNFKRLVPGSLVLGQVAEINSRDIALSLPNNLTGYVPLNSMSDEIAAEYQRLAEDGDEEQDVPKNEEPVNLAAYFSLGQYLRAFVVSTYDENRSDGIHKDKRRIELSINPGLANEKLSVADMVTNSMVQASVVSVEDHGLVMDVGLDDQSVKGFMSSKEVGYNRDHAKIKEGSIYLCLVTGRNESGNILKLSADVQRAGNIRKKHFLTEAPSIDVFLPGTAVEVVLSSVTNHGISGTVMGMLDVTADIMHLGATSDALDVNKRWKVGQKIKARIVCNFPTTEPKKLGVSVLEHVVSLSAKMSRKEGDAKHPLDLLPLSKTVELSRIVKVEPGLGLFIDVGVPSVSGFVHISRIADKRIDNLSEMAGPYALGSTHAARIIGYNQMDGLFFASLQESVLQQAFLRMEDLELGQIVKGTVEKLIINADGVGGLILNLAQGISGLVPGMHLADVRLSHPEKKFKEGLSVTARVLSVDFDKRQIRLTLKKSLVNSETPIVKSYDNVVPGTQCVGSLINILPTGAVVQFYGRVRAFLPKSEMSEARIQDPHEHFRVGQVVNVHVISVDAETQKMLVSCKDPSVFGAEQQLGFQSLQVGQKVNGTVIDKSDDDLTLELDDSKLRANLPAGQLTDRSEKKAASSFSKIRVGKQLKDLVVLAKNEHRRFISVTKKPSLVAEAENDKLISSFEDVKEGDSVKGFVENTTPIGVFVRFGGGVTGLVLKRLLPDDVADLPDYGMWQHQSLSAKVFSVDHSQRKFLLTMRADKDVNPPSSTTKDPITMQPVLQPVDNTIRSVSDFTMGRITKATIRSIKSTQLNVQLADNIQGRVQVSNAFDAWDQIKDRKKPLSSHFRHKQIITVRILGVHHARDHRFLPITHRTGRAYMFELSIKPSDLTSAPAKMLTLDDFKVGSPVLAFVNNVKNDSVWASLSPTIISRLPYLDMSDDISVLNDMEANYPPGSAFRAHVTNIDKEKNQIDVSARTSMFTTPFSYDSLVKDIVMPGVVIDVSDRKVVIALSDTVVGLVHLTDLADNYEEANPTVYKKGEYVRVCVVGIDVSKKFVRLSTRASRVLSSTLPVEDPEVQSISSVKVNDVIRGFVKFVSDKGLFVSLGPELSAFVCVSDLSDSYIKDWKAAFPIDQLVKGKILSVDPLLSYIQMSLKQSVTDRDYVPPMTFDQLETGQIVTGTIRKVEDYGVFIEVDKSAKVSGLCHRSEMAERKVEDVRKLYDEGDVVKAKVLKIYPEKRRINFGLKASYFEGLDIAEDSKADQGEDDDLDDDLGGVALGSGPLSVMGDGGEMVFEPDETQDNAESGNAILQHDQEMPDAHASLAPPPGLTAKGFDWGGDISDDEAHNTSAESAHTFTPSSKKPRHHKAVIKADHTGDLDTHGPQSTADFERLLLTDPSSSTLWLQYMAFQLQLGEVSKAREIAERALLTIDIREEDEKLNIWIGLLNLENTYGSPEALDEVFQRACQYNDGLDISERLANIYIQSEKFDLADATYAAALKKYPATLRTYSHYFTFLFSHVSPDSARTLLPRALQALPGDTHIQLTTHFALLEFHHGDPERGRTLFEGLLSRWPKRVDLWNVLIDAEAKKDERARVRELFERLLGVGLKIGKVKGMFKKWVNFEEAWAEGKEADVHRRAERYVSEQVAAKADKENEI